MENENLTPNEEYSSAQNESSRPRKDSDSQKLDEVLEVLEKKEEQLKKQNAKETRRKKTYRTLLLVAIVVIIILLLRGCGGHGDYWWVPPDDTPVGDETDIPGVEDSGLIDWDEEDFSDVDPLHIAIPVISDFTVSKSKPYKNLYSPEVNANRYYLQYSFTVVGEDEPFYESGLVEGGYQFSVDFGSKLDLGVHKVLVRTKTYEYGTLTERNGDEHEVTVNVVE